MRSSNGCHAVTVKTNNRQSVVVTAARCFQNYIRQMALNVMFFKNNGKNERLNGFEYNSYKLCRK